MVIPTQRLLFITLCGIILIGLTGGVPLALAIAAFWLVAMGILAIIDSLFVPRRLELHWTRRHDTKLSLGAWNPVSLVLHNRSQVRTVLQVRDGVPVALVPHDEWGEGVCEASSTWELAYHVFPTRRGDYCFGPISARYRGPLGLAWRQRSVRATDEVKVYPNLLAIRSYESSARHGRLEELGLRSSRRWGAGTEFERLRDYNPDDEFRRINWKATARRHKLIAAEYQTERSQTLMLLLDAGRLMATRVPLPVEVGPSLATPADGKETRVLPAISRPYPLTRLDYAINAALLLAFVSQQRGDRVGLLAFSDRVQRAVPPRPGRRQFLVLTEALYNLEAESTEANFAEVANHLAAHNPRRSLLVLFTDIADRDAALVLVSHLGRLARRHLPLVVTLRDPGVESLASAPLQDAESAYLRAVARTVLDEREETLGRLRQAGVLTLDASADRVSPSLINRYIEIKQRSGL
jgi:uncharacterized protein (DUF58 family)